MTISGRQRPTDLLGKRAIEKPDQTVVRWHTGNVGQVGLV